MLEFWKIHLISQYPQSECEGGWPFESERIFSGLSLLTLSLGIFLPFHMWPSFSGSCMYCMYYILGNLVFQGTALSPAAFSAALTRSRTTFSVALLSHLFPYSFGGLLKAVLYSLICLFVSLVFELYHFPCTLVVCLSQCSDRPGRWVIVSSD